VLKVGEDAWMLPGFADEAEVIITTKLKIF
jgi:hypothetical protein